MSASAPSSSRATSFPWALLALAAVAAVGAVWLRTRGVATTSTLSLGAQALTGPLLAATGAIVVSRRGHHPMGWFLLGLGTVSVLDELTRGIMARQTLPTDEPWMAGVLLVSDILGGLIWMGFSAFLPLLFPDGEVPSRRWRPVLWAAVVVSVVVSLSILLREGPIMVWVDDTEVVGVASNPIGVSPLGLDLTLVEDVAAALALGLVFAGLAALIVRWRRDAVTRRQIKWILFGFLAAISGIVLTTVPALEVAGDLLSSLAFMIIPITIGVAITRYRLYEIDRIIGRTVTYAVVMAVLVGLYLGSVLTLGAVARAVSGGSNDLVVAGSTLVVAALFQPVRRRVQMVVDRRFNRARYDAQRTAENFGRALRDELDGDAIAAALVRAAAGSLQPQRHSVLLTPRSA